MTGVPCQHLADDLQEQIRQRLVDDLQTTGNKADKSNEYI